MSGTTVLEQGNTVQSSPPPNRGPSAAGTTKVSSSTDMEGAQGSTEEGPPAKAPLPIGRVIGDAGRWQLEKSLILFMISMPGLAHIFAVIFVTPKTDFWCDDGLDFPNVSSPVTVGGREPPAMLAGQDFFNATKNAGACKTECHQFRHDRSFWANTVIMEWDLVCERADLAVASKMVVFAGFAVGAIGAGLLSDMFGRKSAILVMTQILLGAGILATTMRSLYAFMVFWFFTGAAASGTYTVCFVWTMESVSGRWKSITGTLMTTCWLCASAVVSLVSYLARDWKIIMCTLSGLLIVAPLAMNFVPESPFWLLASCCPDKRAQARSILKDAAKKNKRYVEGATESEIDLVVQSFQPRSQSKNETFFDIFKTGLLRKWTLVMFYNWFISSVIVYGLSLNWQSLTGTLFVSFVIGIGVDLISKFLLMFLIVRCGRRWPFIVCQTAASVSFFIMMAFPKDAYPYNWPIILFAMVGRFFMVTGFGILWIYTTELYPTNLRTAGLGSSSFVSRLGGLLANTVGKLGDINPLIPPALFGGCSIVSALVSLMLPETFGRTMPTTIEECVNPPEQQQQNGSKGSKSPP